MPERRGFHGARLGFKGAVVVGCRQLLPVGMAELGQQVGVRRGLRERGMAWSVTIALVLSPGDIGRLRQPGGGYALEVDVASGRGARVPAATSISVIPLASVIPAAHAHVQQFWAVVLTSREAIAVKEIRSGVSPT
jgi:hypothetical protein